jgi:hypothetical protein
MDDKPLLRDSEVFPSDEVIAAVLKDSFNAYHKFVGGLPDKKIDVEWRYYNDGKSWLAKGTSKKKTVFWLSAWNSFFRVSLFFTEKTRDGIQSLSVSDEIKRKIANEPVKGKLIALILDISNEAQLTDVATLVEYKQSLK